MEPDEAVAIPGGVEFIVPGEGPTAPISWTLREGACYKRSKTMNTVRAAIVPGLISGLISIFTSWLWMAVVFHRFQRETPGTWRPEGSSSYILASILRLLSAFGVACLFTLIVRFNVACFSAGPGGSLRFALCLWAAMPLPIILESAIFIRLHRLVVVGQLLDWLTTLVVTCLGTGWWLTR